MAGSNSPESSLLEENTKPGEFILQTLFLEFCALSQKKIEQVLGEPLEKPLTKSLQRGDDQVFDQVLSSLGNVAEQSLPSLLRSLFRWYERQMMLDEGFHNRESRLRHRSQGSKDYLCERRDLAVEFIYCLVLIEVLTKLSYHPGPDDLVSKIITQAFKHFKYKDGLQTNPNAANINIIADLYAEVIGVLSLSRFAPVRKTFLLELRELKLRDQTPYTAQSIISLLMGLKFFRVKMHPIEDFEQCVQFLHDLGHYFLEVKDRDIKHALASLFVEILLPVASSAKHEVNVPVLKNLVETMYTACVDMIVKRKHSQHMFPLVTCLLCVSQKTFFLNNWPYFLTNCLSQLKNKDLKMSRVALESLSRLVWVYMVRIKCESNSATTSRLQSIVSSLFPKGTKLITPKDMPLNIFVKIIQFIATERLDFAMKDIIFDLLSVGKKSNLITPDRMSIGFRAFLVIADSLQQGDGDPPMPQSNTVLPSGATVRVKKTFLNKMLTDDTAKHIGLSHYVPYLLKTFDSMLRALDLNIGRTLLLTKPENVNKEPEELLTGDRKAKMDLFRTCIAAIPRLIPDGMSKVELVELVTRLTVHFDEELRGLAFQALQNLMVESDVWKEHVIRGFVQFIQKDISDTNFQQLDSSLRLLMQLVSKYNTQRYVGISGSLIALHEVEGLALVMLCNHRTVTRKLALHLLKEVRQIFSAVRSLSSEQTVCTSLLEKMDDTSQTVVERLLPSLSPSERTCILNSSSIDLQWLLDRSTNVWSASHEGGETSTESSFAKVDPWMQCIATVVSKEFAMATCPLAVAHSWPIVYTRLNALYTLLDPNTMINENRASSFIRSGSKKVTTEKDLHMQLWQNYVILACSVAQTTPISELTPEPIEKTEEKSEKNSNLVCSLFKQLVPLIKCESADMRDTIVNGLGYTNPAVFKELMEELVPLLKEAIERKTENIKRRRKRDVFRVQLAHIFELMAEHKVFAQSESAVIDKDDKSLTKPFVEYIDGARLYLEGESDRDLPTLQDIRLHFSTFVRHLICNTPADVKPTLLTRDLKYSLFDLFASWSGKFSHTSSALDKRLSKEDSCSELELAAVRAMSAVVCCGPVFDPNGLNDDGYIYHWLDTLLSSHDDRDRSVKSKIYDLAKETVVLLLDYNSDNQGLLDWVIDRCYTGTNEVSDGCFHALAAVFQTREYPCDHVAMLNLAILNVGNPRIPTHETAVQLLHLLDRRFFQEESVLKDKTEQHQPLNDVFLSVSYCKSQVYLSDQLARLHPELTMPIFSEITHRFQTAKPAVRQTLLKYLLPWLHNMELVDPSLPQSNSLTFPIRMHENYTETFKPPLKGEGWGSQEATKMVLNNLFYITVKFGDDHPQELEALWAALVLCWPNNIRVVMHYLVIIVNMAASELLPHAKRVVSYIGRTKPERLVDELMAELQTVETLNMNIERTQTPPFFRLSVIKRPTLLPNVTDDEKLESQTSDVTLEKGTLHTKRHSANQDDPQETTPRTDSTQDNEETSVSSEEEISLPSPVRGASENRRAEDKVPYPLPMPAYGGYFAPLSEYLPDNHQPSSGFHRTNIAIMFMSDLVLDGLEIDWSAHLPLMLHVIFLGVDHNKELVYEHCKKLLLNLMLLAANQDCPEVARLLLSYQTNLGDTLHLMTEIKDTSTSEQGNTSAEEPQEARPLFRVDSSTTLMPGTPTTPPTPEQPSTESGTMSTDPDTLNSVIDIVKAVLEFMNKRRGRPLWCYEDITPKTLITPSSEQLEYFLRLIVKFFKHLSPLALVEQRWSQVAMQLALSCSSRHYAGRSFQVLRALHIRPSSQMLADILSRLVETVAEQGDDMQGYVTEIILTLEAVVDNIDLEVRPIDYVRDIFSSTPNLAHQTGAEARRSVLMAPKQQQSYLQHHARSTSYSVQPVSSKPSYHLDSRNRSGTDLEARLKTNIPRSRSEKSLKNSEQGIEDKLTIVTQMFWIAVSLLESDFEHEFLLATRLLDKILQHLQPDRPECREKIEKIQQQIKWTNFPGVQTLLLKGCTSPIAAESTWQLLTRLTVCINSSVIDPTGSLGFPMNVIALLPYLVHNYENPSQLCRDSADHISQICAQKSDRFNNLGTVMSLYSRGTFGKDSFQWTKCVVKYIHDVYSSASLTMVTFLVEVLEKGPHMYQLAVLQILHCMVHYIDLNQQPSTVLNQELYLTVAKHLEGPHWKEAIKILRLTVQRSSTLTAATTTTSSSEQTYTSLMSFADIDVVHKKELPGRTLNFSVDLSTVNIIGRKYLNPEIHGTVAEDSTSIPSNQSSLSRKGSGSHELDTCWKKPQNSQARTREHLTELLACYGQKRLPKSPSVIFSQSSDTLDHQQSIASSGDDSIPDIAHVSSDGIYSVDSNGLDIKMTIKDFDFLGDYIEGDTDDNDFFPQFDNSRRHSYDHDSPDPDHPRQRVSQFGSTPDLNLLSKMSLTDIPVHGISIESINIDRETLSGRESVTSTPDESIPQCTTPCASSVIVIQNPGHLEEHENSPLTASTHSINSICSDPEESLGASAASSTFPNIPMSYLKLMIQSDEVDEAWKQHVAKVISESSVTNTISTSQIFPRLYRELRRRLGTLTKDAYYYIAKTGGLKSIGAQLLEALDTMFTHMECPYFFIETDILVGSKVVDKHKHCLLEMDEYFQTYCLKKDLAEQSLECIKSSIKQQSLGDGGSTPVHCSDQQKMELCHNLYKLIFQLLVLFMSYMKLLDTFKIVQSTTQVTDVTTQVEAIKVEITSALKELENGQVSPLNVDSPKPVTKQEAFTSLLEYLKSQHYQKALQLLRSFRTMWPGDMFGQSNDDDVVTLLNIYCGGLIEKKSGLFVLTKLEFDTTVLYSQLLDTNQQLRNWSVGSPQLTTSEANDNDIQDSSTL